MYSRVLVKPEPRQEIVKFQLACLHPGSHRKIPVKWHGTGVCHGVIPETYYREWAISCLGFGFSVTLVSHLQLVLVYYDC